MAARSCFSFRLRVLHSNKFVFNRKYSTESLPKYPPIEDTSKLAKWYRRKQKLHDNIRALPTVEEKLLESTRPRHDKDYDEVYGIPLCGISNRYNTLPFRQHVTRTKLIRQLPPQYKIENSPKLEEIYTKIKPSLIDAILLSNEIHNSPPWEDKLNKQEQERIKTNATIDLLFRCLRIGLAKEFTHLQDFQVDVDPRNEAFWYCGGYAPKPSVQKIREKTLKILPKDDPVDLCFLYQDKPHLQIRTELPLPLVVPWDDPLCQATPTDPAPFPYYPNKLGHGYKLQYPIMLPGFWPGDPSEFGHTLIQTRETMQIRRERIGIVDEDEAILEFGLLSSFAWLLGISTFQGFDPFNETEHPFTTQTIITNGQLWSFFVYQLNTTFLINLPNNPRCNLCWASNDMKLYDTIEDGKLKGLNDDVLKTLIKFLSAVPVKDEFLTNKPYLRANMWNDENWEKLTTKLQDMYSRRPPFRTKRRAYDWEKYYLFKKAYMSVNPNRRRF